MAIREVNRTAEQRGHQTVLANIDGQTYRMHKIALPIIPLFQHVSPKEIAAGLGLQDGEFMYAMLTYRNGKELHSEPRNKADLILYAPAADNNPRNNFYGSIPVEIDWLGGIKGQLGNWNRKDWEPNLAMDKFFRTGLRSGQIADASGYGVGAPYIREFLIIEKQPINAEQITSKSHATELQTKMLSIALTGPEEIRAMVAAARRSSRNSEAIQKLHSR